MVGSATRKPRPWSPRRSSKKGLSLSYKPPVGVAGRGLTRFRGGEERRRTHLVLRCGRSPLLAAMRFRHHLVQLNGALRSGMLAVLMGCLFGRTLFARSQPEIKRTAEPDNLADHAESLVGFAEVEDVGFERGIGGVGQQLHAIVQQAHTFEGGVGVVHA